VLQRAKNFEKKGYVVRLQISTNSSSGSTNTTGALSAGNLRRISEQYLGIDYGGDYGEFDENRPRCLDCQTFVEKVMIESLKDQLGGIQSAIRYITHGATKKNRIQTPIPGWLHEPNGWPAREATREVAESSGIGADVRVAHWIDHSGGLGDVDIAYIPWSKVPELKGNDTIDGTLVAFVSKTITRGVTHVGMLFNDNGKVTLRHSTKPKVIDVSIAQRVSQLGEGFYTGIIILRPDPSKLKK
jgi:hypothetical protein